MEQGRELQHRLAGIGCGITAPPACAAPAGVALAVPQQKLPKSAFHFAAGSLC
jgi:hypothetical protein